MLIDPLKYTAELERIVVRGIERKYYRAVRAAKWYGGIATADCTGCNLKCIFCWSGLPRDQPHKIGEFYSPEEIFKKLDKCASTKGYTQLRISGNEPTIGKEHLLKLLELVEEKRKYTFILETNGILIGSDASYAKALARFKCLHVRVSLKGTNSEEFAKLTNAVPQGFELQLKALENLLNANVRCHPAVMLSFSTKANLNELLNRLKAIDQRLAEEVEEEYVFLYPLVVERLNKAGIKPLIAYTPSGVPKELI
jgi:uncharacterized Fe-S cluster-containing radical SAM superfamily protein